MLETTSMFDIVLEVKTNRLPCSKLNVFANKRLFRWMKLAVGVLMYFAPPTSKARKKTKSLDSIAARAPGTLAASVKSCERSMATSHSVTS